MVTLYLVRHGQAYGTRGRCIGHTDVALSLRGRSAIARLAQSLATIWRTPPDRLTTSDLRRAAESARLLAASWAVRTPDAQPEPRLRELAFGDWEGRRWAEIVDTDALEFERWATDWATSAPPRGESFAQLVRRVADWIEDVRSAPHMRATPAGDAKRSRHLAVAHGGSIRAALVHCCGWSPARAMAQPIEPGHVTMLDLGPTGARLLGVNERLVSEAATRSTCPRRASKEHRQRRRSVNSRRHSK